MAALRITMTNNRHRHRQRQRSSLPTNLDSCNDSPPRFFLRPALGGKCNNKVNSAMIPPSNLVGPPPPKTKQAENIRKSKYHYGPEHRTSSLSALPSEGIPLVETCTRSVSATATTATLVSTSSSSVGSLVVKKNRRRQHHQNLVVKFDFVHTQTHPVPSRCELSQESKRTLWYSRQEYKDIQKSIDQTVALLRSGNVIDPEKFGLCYRGLEDQIPSLARRRDTCIDQAIDSVLDKQQELKKQEQQEEEGGNNIIDPEVKDILTCSHHHCENDNEEEDYCWLVRLHRRRHKHQRQQSMLAQTYMTFTWHAQAAAHRQGLSDAKTARHGLGPVVLLSSSSSHLQSSSSHGYNKNNQKAGDQAPMVPRRFPARAG